MVPLQRWNFCTCRSLTPGNHQANGRSPGDRPLRWGVPTSKGLLNRNECCRNTTVLEDLAIIPPRSRLRRFFATPLHDTMLRRLKTTALAKAKGNSPFPRVEKRRLGKQVRDGRQDQHQAETTEPSRDRRPGTGASSLVSLCHGIDDPADPPTVRRRGVLLERGRAL
jgi:hypothetical protein